MSQQWFNQRDFAGGNPYLDYEKLLGLPNNFGETGFPEIGESSLIFGPSGTMYTFYAAQIISNLDENITKTKGRHQMQFGGRYRHERFGDLPDQIRGRCSL